MFKSGERSLLFLILLKDSFHIECCFNNQSKKRGIFAVCLLIGAEGYEIPAGRGGSSALAPPESEHPGVEIITSTLNAANFEKTT